MRVYIDDLLATAEMLLGGEGALGHTNGTPGSAGRAGRSSHSRGAAFALRSAVELSVAARIGAHVVTGRLSQRAAFLWLRGCADAETARRAKAVWSQLCVGCHYHQYEIGPTKDQVRAWHAEVVTVVALLAPPTSAMRPAP
ncbi:hypothetical protein [Streptomyces sp. NPDC088925]|uniref:hypothetical protein n=1 Tax=Streptomyces sp. NPDC088925 TaxID=3365914 RepID=UPI0037F3E5F6